MYAPVKIFSGGENQPAMAEEKKLVRMVRILYLSM